MSIRRDGNGTPIWDFGFTIARGEVPGLKPEYKFGKGFDIGTSQKTLWDSGSDTGIYTFPLSAQVMKLSSTSSFDTCGRASSAEYGWINYLGSGYNEFTEVLSLNNRVGVSPAHPVLRVNRMKMLSSDPNLTRSNTGHIWLGTGTVTAGKSAVAYGHIEPGAGQTYQGFYTVPAGCKAYIFDVIASSKKGKTAELAMFVKNISETFSGFPGIYNTFQGKNHFDLFENVFVMNRKMAYVFPEKTDINWRGLGGATETDIQIEWTMIIEASSGYNSNKSL